MGERGDEPNELQAKEQMYRIIVSQLFYDGHQQLAMQLTQAANVCQACPPSNKLVQVVQKAMREDDELRIKGMERSVVPGLDLEFETEAKTISPEPSQYEICYMTSHKGPCRTLKFHPNGKLVATGSQDASIKILDVQRCVSKLSESSNARDTQQLMETHPVIRTLYDHQDEITCLDFHPTDSLLVSGSNDFSVRFFDYSKPSIKKASKSIQESHRPTCLSLHPGGDHLLVGTEHPTIRLYDANTFQCFVGQNPKDQHTGRITSMQWSPNANMFVSAAEDGVIKIWDGVSQRVVLQFDAAHDGAVVTSVAFTRNNKYILSAAHDMLTRLWELSTARCLIAYTGAGAIEKPVYGPHACFNHTESFVLQADEATQSLCTWDSRSAERQQLVNLAHQSHICSFAHSPSDAVFASAGDDCKAKFWCKRPTD